jgi:2-keto-4-pentenoate hydratase/2-oxohepta-3-ene-1,7-dioic acid hydratase in catechol pathway
MKLLRYGPPGCEKPGLLDRRGNIRSLAGHVSDIGGATLAPAQLDVLRRLDPEGLPLVEGEPRLGPPVAGVGNVIAIGLNYPGHGAQYEIPSEPIIFYKHTGAVCGPNDPIEIPTGATRVDWEVELAVVIGQRAKRVSADKALDHVAGYTLANDVSERDFQNARGGQFIKGKSYENFCPLGPWLVTTDEAPDPQDIGLWLDVNGRRVQDDSTAKMIFPVRELVSYVSQFMALLPGDVIITGTPPGVGLTRGWYLKAGDEVELGASGLGAQRQRVICALLHISGPGVFPL